MMHGVDPMVDWSFCLVATLKFMANYTISSTARLINNIMHDNNPRILLWFAAVPLILGKLNEISYESHLL